MHLEGLGQLKKFNDLIGNQTRDLPDCSIVPQPTMLPRASSHTKNMNTQCGQDATSSMLKRAVLEAGPILNKEYRSL
jgi:hypothetical protein